MVKIIDTDVNNLLGMDDMAKGIVIIKLDAMLATTLRLHYDGESDYIPEEKIKAYEEIYTLLHEYIKEERVKQ